MITKTKVFLQPPRGTLLQNTTCPRFDKLFFSELSRTDYLITFVFVCRVLIPDEHLVWWPEHLMSAILAHVHYLPSQWRGNAHTNNVRTQFSQLFQYKAVGVHLVSFLISQLKEPFACLKKSQTSIKAEFFKYFNNLEIHLERNLYQLQTLICFFPLKKTI